MPPKKTKTKIDDAVQALLEADPFMDLLGPPPDPAPADACLRKAREAEEPVVPAAAQAQAAEYADFSWQPWAPEDDFAPLELRHDTPAHDYTKVARRISEAGRRTGQAQLQLGRGKTQKEQVEARLFLQVKATLELNPPRDSDGKKVRITEALVEATYKAQEPWASEWLRAVNEYYQAEAAVAVTRGDFTAYVKEADSLLEVGRDRRKEMERGITDPTVLTPEERARRVNENTPAYNPRPE